MAKKKLTPKSLLFSLITLIVLSVLSSVLGIELDLKDSGSKKVLSEATTGLFAEQTVVEAKVARVVDGDTIELESGHMVRYIGIDTPETKHPQKGVECFGKKASAQNKALVLGKTVRLEKDVSNADRYGRELAYVYVEDVFVNEYLVREGYAHAASFPPDVAYQELFQEAEVEAREQERGLWGEC